jgi:hypothetical protein
MLARTKTHPTNVRGHHHDRMGKVYFNYQNKSYAIPIHEDVRTERPAASREVKR